MRKRGIVKKLQPDAAVVAPVVVIVVVVLVAIVALAVAVRVGVRVAVAAAVDAASCFSDRPQPRIPGTPESCLLPALRRCSRLA